MELKFGTDCGNDGAFISFNRTFMELKWATTDHYSLTSTF